MDEIRALTRVGLPGHPFPTMDLIENAVAIKSDVVIVLLRSSPPSGRQDVRAAPSGVRVPDVGRR